MATRRALIIGGSVGGLFAAHMLGRIGWEVDVFERAREDLAGRGAGIGTHPALGEVMRQLGLAVDESLCVATGSYVCWDNADRLIHEVRQQRMMSAWAPLYRALRDNLRGPRYHRGMECIDVRSDAGSATARFADGSEARGDLLIAAEGLRSAVRARLLSELQPAYAGYVAWRALLPESEAVRATRDILERDYLFFCVPEGSLALCYTVPARDGDLRVGHRDYNCAWYRPVDEAELAELCTDTSGKCHGTSIPPPLIRPEVVADFRRSARAELASPMADVATRAEQPFFQAIYDLASRAWCSAGWRFRAMPPSSRARTSAPASPRRRSTRSAWPRPLLDTGVTSTRRWPATAASGSGSATGSSDADATSVPRSACAPAQAPDSAARSSIVAPPPW